MVKKIAILMYADDVVILSENDQDLQSVLDALNVWCETNKFYVNENKSNTVNFRCRSNQVTDRSFNIGTKVVTVASEYVYLGLLLTDHFDFTIMAKHNSKLEQKSMVHHRKYPLFDI